MLPIILAEDTVKELFIKVFENEGYRLTVNLEYQSLKDEDGWTIRFEIDPFEKKCLLEGLDDISLTLQHEDKIKAYEEKAGLA